MDMRVLSWFTLPLGQLEILLQESLMSGNYAVSGEALILEILSPYFNKVLARFIDAWNPVKGVSFNLTLPRMAQDVWLSLNEIQTRLISTVIHQIFHNNSF